MAREVEFMGTLHEFPDSFTDDDVRRALTTYTHYQVAQRGIGAMASLMSGPEPLALGGPKGKSKKPSVGDVPPDLSILGPKTLKKLGVREADSGPSDPFMPHQDPITSVLQAIGAGAQPGDVGFGAGYAHSQGVNLGELARGVEGLAADFGATMATDPETKKRYREDALSTKRKNIESTDYEAQDWQDQLANASPVQGALARAGEFTGGILGAEGLGVIGSGGMAAPVVGGLSFIKGYGKEEGQAASLAHGALSGATAYASMRLLPQGEGESAVTDAIQGAVGKTGPGKQVVNLAGKSLAGRVGINAANMGLSSAVDTALSPYITDKESNVTTPSEYASQIGSAAIEGAATGAAYEGLFTGARMFERHLAPLGYGAFADDRLNPVTQSTLGTLLLLKGVGKIGDRVTRADFLSAGVPVEAVDRIVAVDLTRNDTGELVARATTNKGETYDVAGPVSAGAKTVGDIVAGGKVVASGGPSVVESSQEVSNATETKGAAGGQDAARTDPASRGDGPAVDEANAGQAGATGRAPEQYTPLDARKPEGAKRLLAPLITTLKKWGLNTEFHNTIEDIVDQYPEQVASYRARKEASKAAGNEYRKPGMFVDDGNGHATMHIFTGDVIDAHDLVDTVYHEAAGHFGMRAVLGERGFNRFVNLMLVSPDERVRDWIRGMGAKGDRVAADEVMATLQEGHGPALNSIKSMMPAIKRIIRDHITDEGTIGSAIPEALRTRLTTWADKITAEDVLHMVKRTRETIFSGGPKEGYQYKSAGIAKDETAPPPQKASGGLTAISRDKEVPDHVARAVEFPRKVGTNVGTETKHQTKDTLGGALETGEIEEDTPVRLTNVREVKHILQTGLPYEGRDAEGRPSISAQKIRRGTPIVAYGHNDEISAAIVFPRDSIVGRGEQPNEVTIHPGTDMSRARFVVDGLKKLMTLDELREAIRDVKSPGQTLRSRDAEAPALPFTGEVIRPDAAQGADADPITTLPKFRRWFEGSKAVDETGNPVKVYHGSTESGFVDLDPRLAKEVEGAVFFSDNPDVSEQYRYEREYGDIVGDKPGDMVDGYLSIKNPLEVDFDGSVGDAARLAKLVRQAKREGRDGLIIRNVDDSVGSTGETGTTYAIFDGTQFKSTDNNGDLGPTSPEFRSRETERSSADIQADPLGIVDTLRPDKRPMEAKEGYGNLSVGRHEVTKYLRDKFGIGISFGRGVGRGYLGNFHPFTEVIRAQTRDDVTTLSHEIGHWLSKKEVGAGSIKAAGGTIKKYRAAKEAALNMIPSVKAELEKAGYELYGETVPNGGYAEEGIAEMVRAWLSPETDAKTKFPIAYDWLVNVMLADPKFKSSMEGLRDLIHKWYYEGAEGRISGQMVGGAPGKGLLRQAKDVVTEPSARKELWGHIVEAIDLATDAMVDKYMATKRFEDRIAGRGPERAVNLYRLQRVLSENSGAATRAFIDNGVTLHDGTIISEPLPKILDRIKDRADKFFAFAYAVRTLELFELDRQAGRPIRHTGIDILDANHVANKYENEPGFKETAKALNDWANKLVDFLVDTGALTAEGGEAVKGSSMFYIPLRRAFEDETRVRSMGGGKGSVSGEPPLGRLRGSDRPIIHPLDGLVLLTKQVIEAGNRAEMGRAVAELANLYEGAGHFISETTPPTKVKDVPLARVMDQLLFEMFKTYAEQHGVPQKILKQMKNQAQISEDPTYGPMLHDFGDALGASGFNPADTDANTILKLFETGGDYPAKEGVISAVVNGKVRYFEVRDQRLMDAINLVNQLPIGDKWPTVMQIPINALRAAKRGIVTATTGLRAGFQAFNVIRDTEAALVGTQGSALGTPSRAYKALFDEYRLAKLRAEGKPIPEDLRYIQQWEALGGRMTTVIGSDMKELLALREQVLSKSETGSMPLAKRLGKDFKAHPVETVKEVLAFAEAMNRLAEFKLVLEKKKAEGLTDRESQILAFLAASDITIDFKRSGYVGRVVNQFVPFFNPAIQGAVRTFDFATGKHGKEAMAKWWARGVTSLTVPALTIWMLNKDQDWYQELPLWEKASYIHFKFGGKIIRVPMPYEEGYIFGAMPIAAMESASKGGYDPVYKMAQRAPELFIPNFAVAGVKPLYDAAVNWDDFKEREIETQTMRGLLPEDRYNMQTSEIYKWIGEQTGLSPVMMEHIFSGVTGGLSTEATNLFKENREAADMPVVGRFFSRQLRPGVSVEEFYKQWSHDEQVYSSHRKHLKEGNTEKAEALEAEYPEVFERIKYERTVQQRIKHARLNNDPEEQTRIAREFLGKE